MPDWRIQTVTPTKGANTNSPGLVGKEKKYKHRKNCYKQGKHFSPFIISVDCVFGKEAPILTRKFESTHGRKNGGTHFARARLG